MVFNAHPISGVLFVCLKFFFGERVVLCTRRGAFATLEVAFFVESSRI